MICLALMVCLLPSLVLAGMTSGRVDENLEVLRTGCFKYFERGGDCINGPVSLLSG